MLALAASAAVYGRSWLYKRDVPLSFVSDIKHYRFPFGKYGRLLPNHGAGALSGHYIQFRAQVEVIVAYRLYIAVHNRSSLKINHRQLNPVSKVQ